MSDKLAITATMSILMMAGYVLLGTDAARVPLGPRGSLAVGTAMETPARVHREVSTLEHAISTAHELLGRD